MTVIVNDHGFAPEDTGAIAADLPSDFDPKGITAELLKQRSIRITLDSFADGRGFTLAARLRQNGYRGHLRLAGHVLADQYTMARRSGFDDVEIPQDLAARQPEPNGWPAPTGAPMITNHACAARRAHRNIMSKSRN